MRDGCTHGPAVPGATAVARHAPRRSDAVRDGPAERPRTAVVCPVECFGKNETLERSICDTVYITPSLSSGDVRRKIFSLGRAASLVPVRVPPTVRFTARTRRRRLTLGSRSERALHHAHEQECWMLRAHSLLVACPPSIAAPESSRTRCAAPRYIALASSGSSGQQLSMSGDEFAVGSECAAGTLARWCHPGRWGGEPDCVINVSRGDRTAFLGLFCRWSASAAPESRRGQKSITDHANSTLHEADGFRLYTLQPMLLGKLDQAFV